MEFAICNGERRRPVETGDRATCPCCKAEVVAKCGSVVSHHWAHRADDCDAWSEPESEWHRHWKGAFATTPADNEVVIGPHRADVQRPSGVVVEIQKSPLSVDEVTERQDFYTRNAAGMVWLFSEDWLGTMRMRKGRDWKWDSKRKAARRAAVSVPFLIASAHDVYQVTPAWSFSGTVPSFRFGLARVSSPCVVESMWTDFARRRRFASLGVAP